MLVCFVVAAFLLLGVKTLSVVLYVAIPFAMEFHLVYMYIKMYYKNCGQGHQDIGISSFNGTYETVGLYHCFCILCDCLALNIVIKETDHISVCVWCYSMHV